MSPPNPESARPTESGLGHNDPSGGSFEVKVARQAAWFSLVWLVLVSVAAAQEPPESPDLNMASVGAGTISQGETRTHPVVIDAAVMTSFWLMYDSGRLDLAMISPSGDVFDSLRVAGGGNSDGMMTVGDFPLGGRMTVLGLNHPVPGTWTARITAQSVTSPSGVTAYALGLLFAESDLTLSVVAGGRHNIVGEPLVVVARLEKGAMPIRGATVSCVTSGPGTDAGEVQLLDSGVAPDSVAGDGAYSGKVLSAGKRGEYTVSVRAVGKTGDGAVPFERTAVAMVVFATSTDPAEVWDAMQEPEPTHQSVAVHAGRESVGKGVDYVYAISNGSPFPITSFSIEGMREAPIGYSEATGYRWHLEGPKGWWASYSTNTDSIGTLWWHARDSTAYILSGESRDSLRVSVPHGDAGYSAGTWVALSTHKVFRGSVSAGGRLVGDAMARLGEVRVTPDEKGGASIRFPIERDTAGVVGILNSSFEPVRWLDVDSSAATEAEIHWDFKNQAGQRVPSGEYYAFVKVGTAERYGRIRVGTK
jgi:hypothetical protein